MSIVADLYSGGAPTRKFRDHTHKGHTNLKQGELVVVVGGGGGGGGIDGLPMVMLKEVVGPLPLGPHPSYGHAYYPALGFYHAVVHYSETYTTETASNGIITNNRHRPPTETPGHDPA
jgi:hypothetical protein